MKNLTELVDLAKEYDSATTAEEALAINNQFKATANRETILDIAEAYRALEQLKEQYLNNWSKAEKESSSLEMKCVELEQRAEAAEAKLAELEKQPPVARVMLSGSIVDLPEGADLSPGTELFTRPATAINLAELVPDTVRDQIIDICDGCEVTDTTTQEIWNLCRAAIMPKIEELK